MDKPIFEVRYKDNDRHYKIYENGMIEGFEAGAIIINRIPPRIYEAQANASLSDSCPSRKVTYDASGCEQETPL